MKRNKSVLKKTYPFLNLMYNNNIPKRTREMLLRKTNGNTDLLKSAKEIALNIDKGNLNVGAKKKKISPYIKKVLKCNVEECKHPGRAKKCSTCKHQTQMLQKGDGFFAVAIPVIASIAASLMNR